MDNSKIMENDLSMPDILKEFNSYETNEQKAKYLREMGTLNLPYQVKWENLAKCWEGSKPWPKLKEEKDESIMKDYLVEVSQGTDDKPLTTQEKDAIL